MRLWVAGIIVISVLGFIFSGVSVVESPLVSDSTLIHNSIIHKSDFDQSTEEEKAKIVEQGLSEHMAVVASHYEMNIRYPEYSIPINEGQTDLLEPLKVFPVSITPGENEKSSAQLAPERFAYNIGDTIKATLTSTGEIKPTKVSMVLVENNRVLGSFKVKEKDNSHVATLDSKDNDWPIDLHIKASFNFGENGRLVIISPIKLSPDNGTILSKGESYVDDVNLIIPVELNINEAGRYRLSVNFFNEAKQPIAHLTESKVLTQGENTWLIKVHSEVLRSVNNPGPYLLDTWTLTKLPDSPAARTSYGKSNLGQEKVNGFSLDQYDTTTWNDPQDQARLEFLKKL